MGNGPRNKVLPAEEYTYASDNELGSKLHVPDSNMTKHAKA